jgi:hypothetical protein
MYLRRLFDPFLSAMNSDGTRFGTQSLPRDNFSLVLRHRPVN